MDNCDGDWSCAGSLESESTVVILAAVVADVDAADGLQRGFCFEAESSQEVEPALVHGELPASPPPPCAGTFHEFVPGQCMEGSMDFSHSMAPSCQRGGEPIDRQHDSEPQNALSFFLSFFPLSFSLDVCLSGLRT
jgi:hypothetical protein